MTTRATTTDLKAESRKWFQEARFGMFVHWGLYAITGRDMWYYSTEAVDKEYYERLVDRFNPVDYDPVKWARLAREAGMRYAVFVAKHHDGFCLWDSRHTDFKITNGPYGRDLLRPWLEAYRAEGLKVGVYHSLIDWHHPHFTVDYFHPQRARADDLNRSRDFRIYLDYLHSQVRELMTDFGRIDIYWPDFSYGPQAETGLPGKQAPEWRSEELKAMVEELQPGILVNNRLGFSGIMSCDFTTPEQNIPREDVSKTDKAAPMWEACETLGSSWGYCRGDGAVKSVALLIRHLVTCVSNNGNLLLNVGPTPRGRIQPEFMERLEEVGRWLDLYGESIYGAGASRYALYQNFCPVLDCALTQRGNDLYLHFFDQYPPFDVILKDLAGDVDFAEFVSDRTEVEHEDIAIAGKGLVRLRMPPIMPDPYDTVVHIRLK